MGKVRRHGNKDRQDRANRGGGDGHGKMKHQNKALGGNNTSTSSSSSAGAAASSAPSSVYKREVVYPSPCTQSSLSSDVFVSPSSAEYDSVVEASYKGFVVDQPAIFPTDFHSSFKEAFEGLEPHYFFDITQPAGLNTKLAKTLVSRCLVGQPGITYKYLGLRMFAIPWTAGELGATPASVSIGTLNKTLEARGKVHLNALSRSRPVVGSTAFNLTLINKCFATSVKEEARYKGDEKVTVSWHADSSLEHYSTIGVYHLVNDKDTIGGQGEGEGEGQGQVAKKAWRVGLRVEWDAEGPTAGKLKAHNTATHNKDREAAAATPPISAPLPSGACYFLLDDFNHHHQHSVLAGEGYRYSSTHRVGRMDGHHYSGVLEQCQRANSGARRNTAKAIRSEQSVLDTVEFEWVRQFYIQGKDHFTKQVWWHAPIEALIVHLCQLEERTEKIVADLLMAGLGIDKHEASLQSLPIDERRKQSKKLVKMRKRLETVELGSYDAMAEALTQRALKRDGWYRRDADIRKMKGCTPAMSIPFFTHKEYPSNGYGPDPEKLRAAAAALLVAKTDFIRNTATPR